MLNADRPWMPPGLEYQAANIYASGAVGNGVANDRAALAAADTAALAVGAPVWLPKGAYKINSSITVASPVIFDHGATIVVPTGVTVAFTGSVEAHKQRIITASGTGKMTFTTTSPVYPEWWGAVNGVDTGAALVPYVQAAVDSLVGTRAGHVLLSPGLYISSSIADVVIPSPVSVIDNGRSAHFNHYSADTDVEYMFGGQRTTGSAPTIRLHNQSVDGARNPTFLASRGRNETSNTLLWSWVYSDFADISANMDACDLTLAGGQGGSYIVGTAAVTAASAIVVGTGTSWTSDFVGAIFSIDAQSSASGIVKSVEDTTHLTLESIWSTYGGVTASTTAYHLQGGNWAGSLTSDYRGRLKLGQNYTWLFNVGNYTTGDASPLAVGNGGGSGGAACGNLSYVFNGNRLKGGAVNVSTLAKMDNASASDGFVGWCFRSSDYAGDPTKTLALLKSTNELQVSNGINVTAHFVIGTNYCTLTGAMTATSFTAGTASMVTGAVSVSTNNGIYNAGTNLVGLQANGAEVAEYSTTYLKLFPTTDATALGTAAFFTLGGASVAKTLITGKGRGKGVTSTATAAGTTTLTIASTEIQSFTGSTTQTVQFPAANLLGAGIAVCYTINNQSSGTVTPTRAGSDTFQGGGTTDPVLAGASQSYASDGVSVWLKV